MPPAFGTPGPPFGDRFTALPTATQKGLLYQADGQLGRGVQVVRGGPPVPLIRAEGSSQGGLIATLHCQPSQIVWPVGQVDRSVPLLGRLQWGQGGGSFEALIDLRAGVVASVVASSVTLSAELPGTDANLAESAFVNGAVVWGTRPGRARATRTLAPLLIPAAGTGTWEVPAWGYSVAFYTTIAAFYAAASTSVISLHSGPAITDDPQLAILAGTLGAQPVTLDGIALPGSAHFVSISNATGAPLPIRPVFCLEL